jgi:hypothetical protein
MRGLLIDRKKLVKHKLNKLLDISGKKPDTTDNIGIVFIIPNKQYNFLVDGDEKLSYIQSTIFTNSIQASYFIIYNVEKKLCEIRENVTNQKHLNYILKSIKEYLPNDITIWLGVVPIETSENYIKVGFDNPHIADHSPLKHSFKTHGVAFSKSNNSHKKISEKSVRNELIHASTQTGSLCNIYACFTPTTITYLQKINNPSTSKELSGSLVVSNVIKNGHKLVFELSPDPSTEKMGEEEEVDAVWGRYNFHTHPKKAYENHGVTRGWPSSQDYVGFLQLNNHTIFHTVVTLEGIYIISLSPEWSGNVNNIDKKYILKHYDIDHKNKITFSKYVDIINKKKYKGVQLFVVIFLPWNKSTDIFPVFYSKTGNKCLATEEAFQLYNQ